MSRIFVDTAGWAALANQREYHHQAAKDIFDKAWTDGTHLFTTSLVLAELTSLLTRMRITKTKQVELIDDLTDDTSVRIIFIDEEHNAASWKLWRERLDKEWSFIDCSSFVVMNLLGITDAVTSDHHFEQAGFIQLLK